MFSNAIGFFSAHDRTNYERVPMQPGGKTVNETTPEATHVNIGKSE